MSDPQIIRTQAGEELVVLPRAEYEALRARAAEAEEDADDIAIYDARKSEIAATGETPLPAAVGAALLKGDSLLKALRRWRGLSQAQTASRAGIGQGYLSDLENRRRAGTPETIEKLAAVLNIPASWLR